MSIQQPLRDSKGRLVANPDTPTLGIVAALNDGLKAIRARHLELPPMTLVVGATGKRGRSQVHGHFSAERWDADKGRHELFLSGESLKRGAEATFGTLLHESAHALAYSRGIQDTSRQGRYHNKRFQKIANEVGISVEHDDRLGWSLTSLPDTTAKAYKAEIAALTKALKGYRISEPDKPKAPKTTVKIECDCGRTVTVPISFFDSGKLLCGECDTEFEAV